MARRGGGVVGGWWGEGEGEGWRVDGRVDGRGGAERDGAGFLESENGIPESLILLVNKCLGDSLLVHSYRPSFVSRRHCVLRFYLVFRSNGFWGPSRGLLRESLGLPLSAASFLRPRVVLSSSSL